MNATRLQYVLIGLIVLMLGGFIAGAWWVQGLLASNVRTTSHASIDAEISAAELQQLKSLKKQLADQQDIVERTKQIAAPSEQYRYQDQVIKDVADYATRHGISINTIDFSASNTPQPNAGGAKRTAFNVTLKGPVPYLTFLRFLRDIEKNLTKIQLTSLTLTPDKDPKSITNPALGLEVYLKS